MEKIKLLIKKKKENDSLSNENQKNELLKYTVLLSENIDNVSKLIEIIKVLKTLSVNKQEINVLFFILIRNLK